MSFVQSVNSQSHDVSIEIVLSVDKVILRPILDVSIMALRMKKLMMILSNKSENMSTRTKN